MRLFELTGTFALAIDAGMGLPAEHSLRVAALAVRLGELAGAPATDVADAFYLAQLRYAGCTSDAHEAAGVMGDEGEVRSRLVGVDFFDPLELLPALLRAVAAGKGAVRGAAAIARALATMPTLFDSGRAHCEVADRLAQQIGFHEPFRAALFQTFERWDGKGIPRKLKHEGVAPSMRLAHVAAELDVGFRLGGLAGARALLAKRAGKLLDPRLVERALAHLDDLGHVLDGPSAWSAAAEAEPAPVRTVEGTQVDEVLRAMAHFADLKSHFTRGHSTAVARLARGAARQLGLGAATETLLERAGWLHDLGRVAITAAIWDKPGALTDLERERVRTHSYVGERLLSRAQALAPVSEISTLAHERLDGAGYHRKLTAAACTGPARLLAAADVYSALTEQRPHRPARHADEAASVLSELARAQSLCPDAVAAVLAAAGHDARPRIERPAGLTEREIDVLRLVARGLTNKEIASALDISTKTAGNHLQNIYEKLGVTTRSAAALFAMQHGLLA
jgi:HD-GYP domain-containing protein (c-di-GMP phosphodiesterase class II)